MIRTWLNYDSSTAIEECDEVSMAVPDQTFTVRQLFERMASGMSLDDSGIIRPIYYDDNEDIDNPDPTKNPAFDLADYSEQIDFLNESIEQRKINANKIQNKRDNNNAELDEEKKVSDE